MVVHALLKYVPLPQVNVHDLQAVCDPATSWYVLAPQVGQVGVVVAVQLPVKYEPAEHDVVHVLHESWLVAAS